MAAEPSHSKTWSVAVLAISDHQVHLLLSDKPLAVLARDSLLRQPRDRTYVRYRQFMGHYNNHQDSQQQPHNNAQAPASRSNQSANKPFQPDRARTTEDWEQVRRSVAMLPTGSWALKREQALEALSSLITSMRH